MSLPVICTMLFVAIIPITSLAVDGSARTFSCVDVIPSTGAIVGLDVGGGGVSSGSGVAVIESVDVAIMCSTVDVLLVGTAPLQLVMNRYAATKIDLLSFVGT